MKDARQSLRYPVALRRKCTLFVITFKDLTWKESVATLVDISRQGAGMESDERIDPGFVWFRDRIGGFKGGVLMWCRPAGEKHRAGIRFVPLRASEEQMIREQFELIRSHKPMQKPEAVISTIMESFTRTCGTPKEPDKAVAPGRVPDQEAVAENDIIGQLRDMISNL